MKALKILRQLAPSVCSKIVWFLLKQPWLIYPALRATSEAILLSQKKFPNTNKAQGNAYKHALWTMLLIWYSKPWFSNLEKAQVFAKQISDFHEDCVVNKPIDRAMDLHNNHIGIQLYQLGIVHDYKDKQDFLNLLDEKLENAQFIKRAHYIKNYPYDLVFV